jgi:hypothetical protein
MSYLEAHDAQTTRPDLAFEIYDVRWRWVSRPEPMNHYAQAANEAETRPNLRSSSREPPPPPNTHHIHTHLPLPSFHSCVFLLNLFLSLELHTVWRLHSTPCRTSQSIMSVRLKLLFRDQSQCMSYPRCFDSGERSYIEAAIARSSFDRAVLAAMRLRSSCNHVYRSQLTRISCFVSLALHLHPRLLRTRVRENLRRR